MSKRATAPLLSQITIEHGPPALLGELFLRAEEAIRRRGITLSFATFDDLLAVNARNRESWPPLISIFHPAHCRLEADNSYCIVGRDAAGDVVTTQAGRVFDLRQSSFHDLCTGMGLFYDDPDRRSPGEACEIAIEEARDIRGCVGFSGAMWYRRDHRRLATPALLSRISRAYAYTRWATDYTTAACSEDVMRTSLPNIVGHNHISWGLTMINNPVFGTKRFALFWMNTAEMLAEFETFLASLDTQVNAVVEQRRAKE